MRISIVTLSYNQGAFVERAIGSVLAQEVDGLDYTIVDPGSVDDSRAIIERYRPSLSRVLLEPDHGPAHGLNKGFAQASGEVFGCLNADDVYLPGTLREVAGLFASHPDVALIYGHGQLADAEGNKIRALRSSPFSLWWYAHGAVSVIQQATFFRRSAFEWVGGFNEVNRTCWDGELVVDMALAGFRLMRVNREWGVFTIHPKSISGSGALVEQYRADIDRMFAKITGRPRNRGDALVASAARILKWCRDPVSLPPRIAEGMPWHR